MKTPDYLSILSEVAAVGVLAAGIGMAFLGKDSTSGELISIGVTFLFGKGLLGKLTDNSGSNGNNTTSTGGK